MLARTEKSVLFVIPWQGGWLIGDTDTPWAHGPGRPVATGADVDYLLAKTNALLAEPLTRADVHGVIAGLRPLVAEAARSDTTRISRKHVVESPAPGLTTIAGGKYTTYRVMAADLIDAVAGELGVAAPSVTRDVPLLDDRAERAALLADAAGARRAAGGRAHARRGRPRVHPRGRAPPRGRARAPHPPRPHRARPGPRGRRARRRADGRRARLGRRPHPPRGRRLARPRRGRPRRRGGARRRPRAGRARRGDGGRRRAARRLARHDRARRRARPGHLEHALRRARRGALGARRGVGGGRVVVPRARAGGAGPGGDRGVGGAGDRRRAGRGGRRAGRRRRARHRQPDRRRSWCGTARAARPCIRRSSGRTGGPTTRAPRCASTRRFVRERTGLELDATFPATKLRRVLDELGRTRTWRTATSPRGCCTASAASTSATPATPPARCCPARRRRLGRRAARPVRHPARAAAADRRHRPHRGDDRRRARARRRRRPAGVAVRPALLGARRGEGDARDRRVRARPRGRGAAGDPARRPRLDRVAARGDDELRARGLHPHRGRGGRLVRPPRRCSRPARQLDACCARPATTPSSACRRSRASAPRAGTRAPAARCSASASAPPAPTSPARSSTACCTRSPTRSRRSGSQELWVDGGLSRSAWIVQRLADLAGRQRPPHRPRGLDRARRRHARRPRRRRVGEPRGAAGDPARPRRRAADGPAAAREREREGWAEARDVAKHRALSRRVRPAPVGTNVTSTAHTAVETTLCPPELTARAWTRAERGARRSARGRPQPLAPAACSTSRAAARARAVGQRAHGAVGEPPGRHPLTGTSRAGTARGGSGTERSAPRASSRSRRAGRVGAAVVELPALDRVGDRRRRGARRRGGRARWLGRPPRAVAGGLADRRGKRSTTRTSAMCAAQLVSPASGCHEAPHQRARAAVAVAERRDVDRVCGLHERRVREARGDDPRAAGPR